MLSASLSLFARLTCAEHATIAGERLTAWESFLELLPTLFPSPAEHSPPLASESTCFGAAVQAAYHALKTTGGKAIVMSCSCPNCGWGSLRPRDDPRALGTGKEASLRAPVDKLYTDLGSRCADAQVSVDYVLMCPQTVDLFSCGQVPLNCGGRVYNWPGYNPKWDGPTLDNLIARMLHRETGWEGGGRIRVSEGLKTGRHYGPFGALRHGSDIRLPVLDSDTAFGVAFDYDGKIEQARAFVQCAYLYTTTDGHRRIRVSTAAAGVSTLASALFRSADCEALVGVSLVNLK